MQPVQASRSVQWPTENAVGKLHRHRWQTGTVVRAATGHANLLDRPAAAPARLAGPPVDAELVLHRALRVRTVAEIGALALDAAPERPPHAPAQSRDLLRLELGCRPQRMEPRVPEGLVGVDVPDARDDALVEEHSLQRRPPPGKALGEEAHGEPRP